MKIMCLGDSLTFGTGVNRPEVWTSIAQKELNLEIVNRGVPGDTSGGMLARYHPEVEKYRPQIVVIMGGSNDIFTSGDDRGARSNISALAHQTSARGLAPVVCTPLPIEEATLAPDLAKLIDVEQAQNQLRHYAAWLQQFSATFNVPLVDFWSYFAAPVWRVQDEKLYLDGVHPGKAGHILMAEIFSQKMADILAVAGLN